MTLISDDSYTDMISIADSSDTEEIDDGSSGNSVPIPDKHDTNWHNQASPTTSTNDDFLPPTQAVPIYSIIVHKVLWKFIVKKTVHFH
jgi:hypothetical protein